MADRAAGTMQRDPAGVSGFMLWVNSVADAALKGSAALWWLTAVIGQWIFVFYIIAHYGGVTLAGGLSAWTDLQPPNGYVPGKTIGNIALVTHIVLAVIIHGGGPLQLVPQIRSRFPTFHHWNGRAFMLAAIVASMSGLYMVWVRGTNLGFIDDITITITAALIFIFAALALRYAIARDITTHRRWALRLFMVVSAVWFVRLGIYGVIYLSRVLDIDFRTIAGPVFTIMAFAKFLVPLAILEIYLRAGDSAGARGRFATAALILVATVVTGVGIYAVTTLSWLPRIGM
ncbi:DUF2306 domain-containing protein [bacterium AH-315-P15]|nr:DUF2306 domain-containing protein [bacterium AH-315-P15]